MKETRHVGRSGVWAAAAAMAVCALLAAYLGLSALSTLEWQGVYWQDSRQFQTLCQSWNDRVATSALLYRGGNGCTICSYLVSFMIISSSLFYFA